MSLPEVTYGPLSEWQKPECLFCNAPATQEARVHEGCMSANIRCCHDPKCMNHARDFALMPFAGRQQP